MLVAVIYCSIYIILVVSEVTENIDIVIAVRILGAFLSFFIVCFVDTKRFQKNISFFSFLVHVGQAVIFFLPAFPLAAVLISTFFFVLVSFMENVLGVDPSFLNWPIYYWYV